MALDYACRNESHSLLVPAPGLTRREQFCPECQHKGRSTCWSADVLRAFAKQEKKRKYQQKCIVDGCTNMVWIKRKTMSGLCMKHAQEKRQRQREAERHAREAQPATPTRRWRSSLPRFSADRLAERIAAVAN